MTIKLQYSKYKITCIQRSFDNAFFVIVIYLLFVILLFGASKRCGYENK